MHAVHKIEDFTPSVQQFHEFFTLLAKPWARTPGTGIFIKMQVKSTELELVFILSSTSRALCSLRLFDKEF